MLSDFSLELVSFKDSLITKIVKLGNNQPVCGLLEKNHT